jgi:1-deoxyxylulose-5-phosphate synthase
MQYKKLGSTGLDVSPICIGCMGFGEPSRAYPSWSLDEEVSRSLIRHSIEAGINFFDTANMYSNGGSEEIVGRALKDFTNRDSVVIATKVAAATHNGPNAIGLSRKAIMTLPDPPSRPVNSVGRNIGGASRSGEDGQSALSRSLLHEGMGAQQGAEPAAG